jgi:hypothetical protein
MLAININKRSITPEKAIEILKKNVVVTLEEAKLIVDFMYNFAILSVSQVIINKNSKSDGPRECK